MFTDDIAKFLDEVRIPLRLAATTESGWPAVISLWYVLDGGSLWCATQDSARIVTYLRRDGRCAFEVAPDAPPYRGVRGQATATIHPARGADVLETLLRRYQGGTNTAIGKRLLAKRATEVAIEITPVTFFTWDYAKRMTQ